MTCLETSKGLDTCLVQLSGGRASLLDMLTSPMTSLLSGGETGWRYSGEIILGPVELDYVKILDKLRTSEVKVLDFQFNPSPSPADSGTETIMILRTWDPRTWILTIYLTDQRLVLTHSSLMLENITGCPHPSLSTPSIPCPPGLESSPLTMSTQVQSTNHSSVVLTLTNHSGSVRRHGGGEDREEDAASAHLHEDA